MNGLPGVRTARTATPRKILASMAGLLLLPGGKIIDGAKSRDSNNTGDLDVLMAGLLMGKVTASGKYAPSILGVVASAYTSGGTTLTVSAAQAVEIARRVGSSGTGTLICVGPPTANGTVAETAVTFSAVNTTTGAITVTSLGVDKVAGSFICTNDGSMYPVTFITDEYGIKTTDQDGVSCDVPFAGFPIAALVDASQIGNYPSDTSIIAWVKAKLRAKGYGFMFDDDF
jgi:hypothetical protein